MFRTSITRVPFTTATRFNATNTITRRTMASLSTRQPSAEEKKIIDDVLDLYQLKPSEQAYSHYAETAVFHDPVSIAKGLESIKSQFNGMPKVFSESKTQKMEVLDDKSNPDAIVLNLTQHYVFKGEKTPEKTVNSKITLKRNAQGLIEHHEEEWDHESNKDGSDGFLGKLNELRKKADAKLVETFVSSDPKKA